MDRTLVMEIDLNESGAGSEEGKVVIFGYIGQGNGLAMYEK